MKKFNLLMAVVALLTVVTFKAQNTTDKWLIGVGFHAEDFTSVRGSGYFDVNDYSIVPPLSKLTIARSLSKKFAVDMEASFGQVDDTRLYISDEFYALVGLGIRFNALQKKWVDFYLRGGANYLRYAYEDASFPVYTNQAGGQWNSLAQPVTPQNNNFAATGGAGLNFWFTENFGLNIESNYVWVPASGVDYFDHFQHSVGLLFRFGNKDHDGDGVLDKDDQCPKVAGPAENNGCPWGDADGDGVLDNVDQCPDVPGTEACNGCPDTDGDGVCDNVDKCPDVAGVASNNGCPPVSDRDKDGIADDVDACPDTYGVANSDPKKNGCPAEDYVQEQVKEIKNLASQTFFEFNSDKLTPASQTKLNRVAELMNNNNFSKYNFLVEGHTDSKGSDAYNMTLSQKRAQSVVNYLTTQGISASRLKAIGYGETIPRMPNDTEAGRAQNRRVEIKTADSSFKPTAIILSSPEADKEIRDLAAFIFFVTGKDQLQESSKAQLDVIAQYMLQYPANTYEIQGHTDNTGTDAINNALSQKRAEAVVKYLVGKGVSASNLTAKGYGSTKPVTTNDTPEGKAQNRRVEINRNN